MGVFRGSGVRLASTGHLAESSKGWQATKNPWDFLSLFPDTHVGLILVQGRIQEDGIRGCQTTPHTEALLCISLHREILL